MVRLSIMYPATPDSTFDWDYYLGPHLDLAHRLLQARGLQGIEIDRGIGGLPPGSPVPFHAAGHLFFSSLSEMDQALAATAEEFIADQRKYFSGESLVQIS